MAAAAAAFRSAVTKGASRSLASRSKPLLSRTPASFSLPSSSSSSNKSIAFSASRAVSALVGIGESMMPLHSAVASARLKSNIGLDSACWSWLSQGLGIPL